MKMTNDELKVKETPSMTSAIVQRDPNGEPFDKKLPLQKRNMNAKLPLKGDKERYIIYHTSVREVY